MTTTGGGYTCAYCGAWCSGTGMHWCEKMHPNWTPEWSRVTGIDHAAPGGVYDRIAGALERIAAALGSNQEQERDK